MVSLLLFLLAGLTECARVTVVEALRIGSIDHEDSDEVDGGNYDPDEHGKRPPGGGGAPMMPKRSEENDMLQSLTETSQAFYVAKTQPSWWNQQSDECQGCLSGYIKPKYVECKKTCPDTDFASCKQNCKVAAQESAKSMADLPPCNIACSDVMPTAATAVVKEKDQITVQEIQANEKAAEAEAAKLMFNEDTLKDLKIGQTQLIPKLVPHIGQTFEVAVSAWAMGIQRFGLLSVVEQQNRKTQTLETSGKWFAKAHLTTNKAGKYWKGCEPGSVKDSINQNLFIIRKNACKVGLGWSMSWSFRIEDPQAPNVAMYQVIEDKVGKGWFGKYKDWRVWRGKKEQLLYYCVRVGNTLKFYHAEADYDAEKEPIVEFSRPPSHLAVLKVKESEDTALLLTAAMLIDSVNV